MATIEIRDVLDNETGKTIFPRTHVDAVIGLKDFSFFEEKPYPGDPTKKYIWLKDEYVGLGALGWIAAGGIGSGSGSGGGGLITSVKGVADLGTPIVVESLTETFSAYAIQSIYNSVRLKSAVSLSNVLPYASGRVRVATLTIDGTNHDIYAPEPTGGGVVETETDPIFSASAAFGISTTDIANWNAKVSNVQADWNATTGLAAILNKPSLSAVAISGSYNDLSNKPSIPNEATVSEWGFTKNTGTVTQVAMAVPTGLSVSGSPITASGTIAISFANGYSIPTTAKQSGWDAKYDKPSGGIPKTDLALAVKTSLDKADTALQSETDPTVPSWAKTATKPAYSFSEILNKPTTLDGYGITDGFKKTGDTMTGNILMNGGSVLSATDSTNSIGAFGTRFLAGHIRNIYTTYFAFMSDDGLTQRGNIGMGDGYANINLVGNPGSSYNFFGQAGFFHGGNGDVPCGRSDHRWANIYGVNADLTGDLAMAQTSHIDIGPLRLEYDASENALHITSKDNTTVNLYCDGYIASGGVQQSS